MARMSTTTARVLSSGGEGLAGRAGGAAETEVSGMSDSIRRATAKCATRFTYRQQRRIVGGLPNKYRV